MVGLKIVNLEIEGFRTEISHRWNDIVLNRIAESLIKK